jgi:hypothetical protein
MDDGLHWREKVAAACFGLGCLGGVACIGWLGASGTLGAMFVAATGWYLSVMADRRLESLPPPRRTRSTR